MQSDRSPAANARARRRPAPRAAVLIALPLIALLGAASPLNGRAAPLPTPTHTVIVILENHSASQVYGNPDMPFYNDIARHGARMTGATFGETPYGIIPRGFGHPLPARPSQANYLYLTSANNQGVTPSYFEAAAPFPGYPYRGIATNAPDGGRLRFPAFHVPTGIGDRMIPAALRPFTTPNLGAAVRAHGGTFAIFSETLPYPGFDGDLFGTGIDRYARKHNPVINWIDFSGTPGTAAERRFVLPESVNLGFDATIDPNTGRRYRGFAVDEQGKPLGFEHLPTVSIVIPNLAHDAHDGSLRDADQWLRRNIRRYAEWAMRHNALLILTFDENGAAKYAIHGDPYKEGITPIPTVFYGPMIKPGRYAEPSDHLNVLATMLAMHADLDRFRKDFAQFHTGTEAQQEIANLRPIRDIFGAGPALTAQAPVH